MHKSDIHAALTFFFSTFHVSGLQDGSGNGSFSFFLHFQGRFHSLAMAVCSLLVPVCNLLMAVRILLVPACNLSMMACSLPMLV